MTIQTIQLNKLALSDLNVRKVKPKEIEALAADIQARGVLQNLIGYDEDGKIKIRSEEHTSELQSLMRLSYAVFCLTKKPTFTTITHTTAVITLQTHYIPPLH